MSIQQCIYLPTALYGQDMIEDEFLKQSLTGLISEYSRLCHTMIKGSSLPYNLPGARGRILGIIPFPRVLTLPEMKAVSSISDGDNHYTTSV